LNTKSINTFGDWSIAYSALQPLAGGERPLQSRVPQSLATPLIKWSVWAGCHTIKAYRSQEKSLGKERTHRLTHTSSIYIHIFTKC